jgi:hypothetical protein
MDLDQLEEIDFSCDEGEIEMIRGDVAVLNRYYDEIAAQGGVCRDTAKALVRDCKVQLPDSCPIASFTEVPSRTNLTITQENIVFAAGRMVWDMIKKAAALLAKVMRWIIDTLRKSIGLKRESGKAINASHALAAIRQKYTDLTAPADTHAVPLQRAYREVKEARASYDSNFNDLIVDMLTDERFVTAVRNVGVELLPYHDTIEMKLSLFNELIHGHLNGGDAAASASLVGQLRTIATPIDGSRLNAIVQRAGVKPTSAALFDVCDALRSTQSAMRASKQQSTIEPEDAEQRLLTSVDSFAADFIVDMDSWLKVLDRLDRAVRHLGTTQPSAPPSKEVADAYLRAFTVVEREVQALRQFVVVAEACRTVRDQFCHDLFDVAKGEILVLRATAELVGTPDQQHALKKDLDHVAQELRAA